MLNVEFQSEHFRLHELYLTVSSEYKNILSFYIKETVLNLMKLSEIDPKNKNNYKSLDDVYLGARAILHLNKEQIQEYTLEKRFRNDCLKVIVELFRN